MDKIGHINNSIYLTYYESARVDLFNKWNYKQLPFIMVSAKLDYLKQLHHPSKLTIGSKINNIGKTSFNIKSAIFCNENKQPHSTALITCVCYDYEKQVAIPVPKKIRDLI
tara:strand:- start:165 stop:497 length:333 start_codon:yes stop_codon:yes gene_type:complete